MSSALTRDELIAELFNLGFKPHSTASAKWKTACFFRNGDKTLYILIRVRGIDLLETPLKPGDMLNHRGFLSVSMQREGDRFVEYAYTDSSLSIHERVLDAASMFVQQGELDPTYFQRVGIGPKEWGGKYGNKSKHLPGSSGGGLSDLYYAASAGDGEPAYLGDGMWVTAGGRLEDRD